jgi:hypothetical protein
MDRRIVKLENQADFAPSYYTLRNAIGWITLLMPIVVRVGARVFEGISVTNSISAYYYTGMRDFFVSTLVVGGALLACYRTPKWIDSLLAISAGLAAIGVALFPMNPTFAAEILQRFPSTAVPAQCYTIRGILGYHFLFVGTFFSLAFILVFFRFRAFTPQRPGIEKQHRNLAYKICGWIMLGAFIWVGVLAFTNNGTSIFWPETIAVVAFAIAWLVKGQTLYPDKEPRSWRYMAHD